MTTTASKSTTPKTTTPAKTPTEKPTAETTEQKVVADVDQAVADVETLAADPTVKTVIGRWAEKIPDPVRKGAYKLFEWVEVAATGGFGTAAAVKGDPKDLIIAVVALVIGVSHYVAGANIKPAK